MYGYESSNGTYYRIGGSTELLYWSTNGPTGTTLVLKGQEVLRLCGGTLLVRSIDTSFRDIGEGVLFYIRIGTYPTPVAFVSADGELHVLSVTIGQPPADPQPLNFRIIGKDWDDVVCNIGPRGLIVSAIDQASWLAVTDQGENILLETEEWEFA